MEGFRKAGHISGSSKNPHLYVANTLLYSSHDILVTVLLESIDLLLLQLRVTRPKPMAQRVVPPYILIKRLISTMLI